MPGWADTLTRSSNLLSGDLDTDSAKTMTSLLRNSYKEMLGGLRKEQQYDQQSSKLLKLNTHQNAQLQAGGQHPVF